MAGMFLKVKFRVKVSSCARALWVEVTLSGPLWGRCRNLRPGGELAENTSGQAALDTIGQNSAFRSGLLAL